MNRKVLPLAGYRVLQSRDVDQARNTISKVLHAPHEVRVIGDSARFEARQNAVSLGPVAFAALDYGGGAHVQVTPHHTDNFYLVHVPFVGAVDTVSGRDREIASPQRATIAQPQEPFMLDWPASSPMLLVWFEAAAMNSTLRQLIGQETKVRLRCELGQDLSTPAFRAWMNQVRLAVREMEEGELVVTHPLAVHRFVDLLTMGFLLSARHSYSERLHSHVKEVGSASVKQAVDYLHIHAAEPVTVTRVAAHVGVGVRALQEGFRRHLDTTPMAYLRQLRLKHVRAELEKAHISETTVSMVALRWGFRHLGDFARAYRMEFGERPGETLRSRQGDEMRRADASPYPGLFSAEAAEPVPPPRTDEKSSFT